MLRKPSCGTRVGLRRRCRLAFPDRCANKSSLHPPPAALGFVARASGARVPSIAISAKQNGPHSSCGPFCLAEKEGFEPSRRFPDLRP